ncbi:reverse transcriptase domain-containing protein [Tanacetum coccineum]
MTCERMTSLKWLVRIFQIVLGFSNVIVQLQSHAFTMTRSFIPLTTDFTTFGDSNFLLEEVDAFLAIEDDPTSLEVDDSYYDSEGDILLLESFLNDDPSLQLPTKFDNKLPFIIAKDLFCRGKCRFSKQEDYKPAVQHQRRVNPKIHDVIKKEVEKLLDAGLIYPISDSPWVSPVHCVPKKGGFTVVTNDENELISTRLVTGWRVCIDYRKLNDATCKDHFPLPFMDQILERLAGNNYYCFLDGFSGYFQIPIDPKDQEKTTFTYPYGTLAYRRMPFGLCNAPGTFQRCMMAIFHDMIEKTMEVFMDDFLVFGNSFENCLSRLDKMLQRYVVPTGRVTANVNNANRENGGNGGNGGNNGCSYKGFQACGPKEYDGKGGAITLTRWIKKMESVIDNSGCLENQKVKYATSSFVNKALTWWNGQIQVRGQEAANGMSWNDFKALLVEEFCPSNEMEKLEFELWNHKMVGGNHVAYTDRFHKLARLVPHMVTPESSHIKRYIAGLAPKIRGMVKATQPTTI